MKTKRRYRTILKTLLILAGIVLLIVILIWWHTPEQIYSRNRDDLEEAVETILKTGNLKDLHVGSVSTIVYPSEGKHPVIIFYTSSFGVFPPAPYVGLYYSVDGCPVADEAGSRLIADGDKWKWNGTGDNKGTTWHIEGNWYAFTAWY